MGTSWISRKGENLRKGGGVDLEKGGTSPLTNYMDEGYEIRGEFLDILKVFDKV